MYIAILISDKIDLRLKMVTKDKDLYIKKKDSIHLEDINIYTPNMWAPKYIKQIVANLK